MRRIAEVLTVIAVLACSVGFVVYRYPGCGVSLAKRTSIRLEALGGKLQVLALDCARVPTTVDLLLVPRDCAAGWSGPYARPRELVDAWDNPVAYVAIPRLRAGLLCSFGADDVIGGDRDLCTTVDFTALPAE